MLSLAQRTDRATRPPRFPTPRAAGAEEETPGKPEWLGLGRAGKRLDTSRLGKGGSASLGKWVQRSFLMHKLGLGRRFLASPSGLSF